MATLTTTLEGSFVSTGAAQTIQIRSGIDWFRVYNWTQAGTTQTPGRGVEFYWQNGFAAGSALEWKKTDGTNVLNLVQITSGGFTLVDSSLNAPLVLNNGSTGISAISNATPPVVTVGSTAGMTPGGVVRLYNVTNARQVGGMDFTFGLNTFSGTTFSLDYIASLGAGVGAAGNFAVIPFDPIFYPRRRFISNITQATNAVVTLTVTHGYTVGQAVRFIVGPANGMVQINELIGNITAINTSTNTITVDINTSAFTAFVFNANASYPFSQAQIVPVGEDTALAELNGQNILADATINTAFLGIILAGGAQSPAGSSGDLIYWQGGSVFSIQNP